MNKTENHEKRLIFYLCNRYFLSDADLRPLKNEEPWFYVNMTLKRELHSWLLRRNVTFISLGYNCLPAVWLTRWGLMPTKKHGHLQGPFDTACHPLPMLPEWLENGFNNYGANDYLQQCGLDLMYNSKDCTLWNHDIADAALSKTENIERFNNEILPERIANFYRSLKMPNPVFVCHVKAHPAHRSVLPHLAEVARQKFHIPLIALIDGDRISGASCHQIEFKLQGGREWALMNTWFAARQTEPPVIKEIMEYISANYAIYPLPRNSDAPVNDVTALSLLAAWHHLRGHKEAAAQLLERATALPDCLENSKYVKALQLVANLRKPDLPIV